MLGRKTRSENREGHSHLHTLNTLVEQKGIGWWETGRHPATQCLVQDTQRKETKLPLPVKWFKWFCYSSQNNRRTKEYSQKFLPAQRLRLGLFYLPHPSNPEPSFPSLSPLPGLSLILGKRLHSFDILLTGEQLVGILNKEKDPQLPISSHTMDVLLPQGCSLCCIPQNAQSV